MMTERMDELLVNIATQPGPLQGHLLHRRPLRRRSTGHDCGWRDLEALGGGLDGEEEGDEGRELFFSGRKEEEGTERGEKMGRMASSKPSHPFKPHEALAQDHEGASCSMAFGTR